MEEASIKTITVRYVLSLLLIAFFVLTSYLFLVGSSQEQRTHAAVINIAGRQRMLSQHIALASLKLVTETDSKKSEALRDELEELIDLMAASHIALIEGDAEWGLPSDLPPAVSDLYFTEPALTDLHTRVYLEHARMLLNDDFVTIDNVHLQYLLANSHDILSDLNELVTQYQMESERDDDRFVIWGTVSAVSIILLLVIIAFVIFRPMSKRVLRYFYEMEERVKELDALYQVSNILQVAKEANEILYRKMLPVIRSGLQHPKQTYIRIKVNDIEVRTKNYKKTKSLLSSEIQVDNITIGLVEIGHLVRFPEADIGPFLHEEKDLLKGISEQLGTFIEKELAEAKKQELDTLKTRFIAAFTHVTRTPLNQIRWSIESVLSGDLGPLKEEQTLFLRKAIESEDSILRLIGNMNTTLDIERGRMTLNISSASMKSVVDSVHSSVEDVYNLNDLVCKVSAPKKLLPRVKIDVERIREVLESLLDNAARYSKKGDVVTVKLSKTKKYVRVKITDTGVGIPTSDQPFIFDKFFRASNAQKSYTDGVGLGLFLAKSIVEAHGGKIGYESTEGSGSSFWFDIPY